VPLVSLTFLGATIRTKRHEIVNDYLAKRERYKVLYHQLGQRCPGGYVRPLIAALQTWSRPSWKQEQNAATWLKLQIMPA
jgi:hypothetical protein